MGQEGIKALAVVTDAQGFAHWFAFTVEGEDNVFAFGNVSA
jgi:hypothetical protein